PWRTLNRVNTVTFHAGDTIALEGGAVFYGNLFFDANDSGTASDPVTLTSYGNGQATIVTDSGDAVMLYGAHDFVVANLALRGVGIGSNSFSGIHIHNSLPGGATLSHVVIDAVDAADFDFAGIAVDANGAGGVDDVQITYSRLHDNGTAGLASQNTNMFVHNITKLHIAHVQADNNPGTGVGGGDGIMLGSVSGAIVEHCLAHDNGLNGAGNYGIFAYESDHVTLQYNESYRNYDFQTSDGNGFGFDFGTSYSVA